MSITKRNKKNEKTDSHIIDMFLTVFVLSLFCFTLLNACVQPSNRSEKSTNEDDKLVGKDKINPKKSPDPNASDNNDNESKKNRDRFGTGVRPTVNPDFTDSDPTTEEVQLLADILSFTQNKVEAAWQGAQAKAKKAAVVNINEHNNNTVFAFAKNLIVSEKLKYRKEDRNNTNSYSEKFILTKQQGKNFSKYDILGLNNASKENYDGVLARGTTLLSFLIDSDGSKIDVFYIPNQTATFVTNSLNMATFGVQYNNNDYPHCKIKWNSSEKETSSLECFKLVFDINASSQQAAYNFIEIKYHPEYSSEDAVSFYSKYSQLSRSNGETVGAPDESLITTLKATKKDITFSQDNKLTQIVLDEAKYNKNEKEAQNTAADKNLKNESTNTKTETNNENDAQNQNQNPNQNQSTATDQVDQNTNGANVANNPNAANKNAQSPDLTKMDGNRFTMAIETIDLPNDQQQQQQPSQQQPQQQEGDADKR